MLGTAALDGSGNAALSTSSLSLSNQTITALYSGDDTYASNSTSLPQTVSQVATNTFLTSSANPAQPSQQLTFTATVMPQGSGAPAEA